MKLKRILSGILATAIAVTSVSVTSLSAAADTTIAGSCGDDATWFINSDDILVISGTGKIDSSSGWSAYAEGIRGIVIEEGITSTESGLFASCRNVEEIVFPSSLETLGHCLSRQFTSLTDIWIFSTVLENRFSGNGGTYPQPGSITKWHVYKDSTTEASLREGLKCTDADFEYITENDSFPVITDREPLVLADETETSGPAGLNSSWSWDASTKTLTFSGSGVITLKSGFQKYASYVETVDMGDCEISSICEAAFGKADTYGSQAALCPNLKHLTLPSTMKVIGDYAFYKAPIAEENLYLPEGLIKIGSMAFGQSKITGNLKLPSTIQSIGQQAFESTQISSVEIPEGVSFGGTVFARCNNLKEVTIPVGCTYSKNGEGNASRANKLFSSCTGLEKVIIEDGAAIAEGMFTQCTALSDVYILTKTASISISGPSYDAANAMFDGTPTFHIYQGSTAEPALRTAGYLNDDNVVYLTDTAELEKAIADSEAIDIAEYTDESVKVLTDALTAAKTVMENIDAAQADVEAAIKNITDAIVALEYLPADYTSVESAKAKVPADLSVYTDETVKALTDAVAAVVEGKNITEQSEVDAWAKAIEDAIAGLELKPIGGTVTGTINVSDKDNGTEMTVTAVAADGTEVSITATSMDTYALEELALGDYTLTISGGKYAPRSYEITVTEGEIAQDVELNPYGDINGDGKVTTADVGMANSHAKGVQALEGYKFVCADVKIDESITTADVGMINSHAKGVKALW